ncbi:unnamed protein product [Moneuplotes crassus]|uniref:RING-CH-type domain-containing protein n=1 Tax=Euplotes crassus TaxID=5936 RepID=A0AAD1X844_EUPCR|nr:unnamed protein product [Moneuplotes crassus]
MKFLKSSLSIKICTQEGAKIIQEKYECIDSAFLIYDDLLNEVKLVDQVQNHQKRNVHALIIKTFENYMICQNNDISLDEDFKDLTKFSWQCITDAKETSGYLLSEDEIIRIGDCVIRVRKMLNELNVSAKVSNFYMDSEPDNWSSFQKSSFDSHSMLKMHLRKSHKEETKVEDYPNTVAKRPRKELSLVSFGQNSFIEEEEIEDLKSEMGAQRSISNFILPVEEIMCRICLSIESNNSSNPLFSPCKCKGSMKYVHYKCMQNWLNTKKRVQRSLFHVSYYWKLSSCEVCKHQFDTEVVHNDRVLQLLSFNVPEKENDYIILEVLNFNKVKSIHVINIDHRDRLFRKAKMEFYIGRDKNFDIFIPDISIEKNYAKIELSEGKFYLKKGIASSKIYALNFDPVTFDSHGLSGIKINVHDRTVIFEIKKKGLLCCFPCIYSTPTQIGKPIEDIQHNTPSSLFTSLFQKIPSNPLQSRDHSIEPLDLLPQISPFQNTRNSHGICPKNLPKPPKPHNNYKLIKELHICLLLFEHKKCRTNN